jgi:hypothetical protein
MLAPILRFSPVFCPVIPENFVAPMTAIALIGSVRSHLRHALPIVCGLTALGAGISQDAFAQTIPTYGTNAHCQRVAGFGGTFSRSVYGSCLNMEQSAALALQGRWPSIPASVRERCDRIASFGGSASYSILQNCVDVELGCASAFGGPRGRQHCEVLPGDVGGRPGNPVQHAFRMPGGARQNDTNRDLHQQIGLTPNAGVGPPSRPPSIRSAPKSRSCASLYLKINRTLLRSRRAEPD